MKKPGDLSISRAFNCNFGNCVFCHRKSTTVYLVGGNGIRVTICLKCIKQLAGAAKEYKDVK